MCTVEKKGDLFLLTLTGDGEHRLNPTLLDSILSSIAWIRSHPSPSSSALITTAQGKFFSNGFDLALLSSAPHLDRVMNAKLRTLVTDLISLPMPTIAAVTGHAAAGGLILALAHDYVLMRKDRRFLYMSEVDIGLVIPQWFRAVISAKIGSPAAIRKIVLTAAKLTATEAVQMGVIESAHAGATETVEAAMKLGRELTGRGWDGHVYGRNREQLLGDILDVIRLEESEERRARSRGSKL